MTEPDASQQNTPPKGSIKSFNMFSLPPFNLQSMQNMHQPSTTDPSSDTLAFNPLSMAEFLNLSNTERFQYQHYLNQSMQRQRQMQHLHEMKSQNDKMKAALLKERCDWINDVALICTKRCVGRYSTQEQVWREWISEDVNPWMWMRRLRVKGGNLFSLSEDGVETLDESPYRSPTQYQLKSESTTPTEHPSLSFRLWSKDKIMHTISSNLGMAPKDISFYNETTSKNGIYDRIYPNEEQCIKECIRHMHTAREILTKEWSKHGGFDAMHLKSMEKKQQVSGGARLFGAAPTFFAGAAQGGGGGGGGAVQNGVGPGQNMFAGIMGRMQAGEESTPPLEEIPETDIAEELR